MSMPDVITSDLCLPRRGDLRITDVLPALIACLDPTLPGASYAAREQLGWNSASQAVVVMVDGLGWELLHNNYAVAPTLRHFRDATVPALTVVPSTTAAALTSFGTGAMPAATGMVGYSVLTPTGPMNLLAFGPGYVAEEWQPVPTLFERLRGVGVSSAVVSPATFARSGLTRAALRGADHVSASTLEDRVEATLREIRAGRKLTYLYWSDIDHIGHGHGVNSAQWTQALEEFDRGVGMLLRHLPGHKDIRVVLTADHGMVNIRPGDLTDLARTPALSQGVRAIAGETRAVHIHADTGQAGAVLARWQATLGERAWVVSRAQLASVMGVGPLLDRAGDGIAFMRGTNGVVDSRTQSEKSIALVGVHGSLTSAEMRIPVAQLA